MVDDEDAPVACWFCRREIEAEEPRRLMSVPWAEPNAPPKREVIACMACYRERRIAGERERGRRRR